MAGQITSPYIPTLPPPRTFLIMLTAFVVAASCVLSRNLGLPFSLASIFVYVMDVVFHECGHAITGCLLGTFSVPIPAMFITVTYYHSWTFQIIVFILLITSCVWLKLKKNPETFQLAIALTLMVIALAFSGYGALLRVYMGPGGSMVFGGWFQYRAWVFKDTYNTQKHWFFGWLGFALVLHNIDFCYQLITSAEYREHYNQPGFFGIDNDFIILATNTHFTIETIAAYTIGLGIIITITAFLLAIFPATIKQKKLGHLIG